MIPTVHASAVLVGERAVLIRGPSGAGKSRLVLDLLARPPGGFARLVGDDRVHLWAVAGRLLVRPAPALAGLVEVRGQGIVTLPHEAAAVVGLVVDLADPQAARLPEDAARTVVLMGIGLPRLVFPPGTDPLTGISTYLARSANPP